MRKILVLGTIIGTAVILAACSGTSANSQESDNQASQQSIYNSQQKIPQFQWSQFRQTLIDVETAEAEGVATTTFFFTGNGTAPIGSCPSKGFPVASTAQLNNPQTVVDKANGAVIAQQEPNGIYTGNSTGTYVVCVADSGQPYIQYWEGDVWTVGGPAHWSNGQVVLDGAPTVKAKTK